MKVCFIGVGSIARRHIKNLTSLCNELGEALWVDCVRRNKYAELPNDVKENISKCYSEGEELDGEYDIIFITNPTIYHYNAIEKYSRYSQCFFIEKPIMTYEQMDKKEMLQKILGDKKVYVACPLRYCQVIRYLKENLEMKKIRSLRCISSSYLPDWRPGQDYTKVYSAKKELGGGVSIDLIHEWDYIGYLLGDPIRVSCMMGKKSNLEIDTEDVAIYIAEYTNMYVELHLDYFGRETRREIEILTEDDVIFVDLIKQKIRYVKSDLEINFSEDRDEYQIRELKHAMDIFKGKTESTNDVFRAIRTLGISGGVLI